jgi:hypothetical protein
LGLCQNQELSLGTPLEWMTMTLLVVMKTIGIRDLEGRQNIYFSDVKRKHLVFTYYLEVI